MKLILLTLLCVTAWCHEDHDDDHVDYDDDDGEIASRINWSKAGIVNPAENQGSCGGCWAFVATGLLEAKYAQVTGELVKFSDQYLIDCQFAYSGCAGDSPSNPLQTLEMTQFIPSAAYYPWTGTYSGSCLEHAVGSAPAHTDERNALKDVWVTYHRHISNNEDAILEALQQNPIAVGYNVGGDMTNWGGDPEVFDDKKCLSDGRAHASVLVGYTAEAWILKQSWGVDYGVDGGYTYLKRGSNAIQCNLFKDAVDVQMVKRREIQYKNFGKMHNYADAEKMCAKLDSKTGKSGWTLAVIPTRMHYDEVKALHITKWGSKSGKVGKGVNFNNFWIGLKLAKSGASTWADGFTKLGYCRYGNKQPNAKFRTVKMSKLGAKWSTENPATKMRIVCSRYITCPTLRVFDIPGSESLVFGAGNAALAAAEGQSADAAVEGATVTVTCQAGHHLHGAAEGSCAGGVWTLPECEDEDEHDDKEMTI